MADSTEHQLGTTRRYTAEMLLYRPLKPEHNALVYSILSDEMMWQSTISPGKRDSLNWVVLRPEDKIKAAGLPGEVSKFDKNDAPAVLLNYDIRWSHTFRSTHWTYEPSPKEDEWRALARDTYRANLLELSQKPNPDDEDKEKMSLLQDLIAQLSSYGEGYLETAYGLHGTDVSGIHWGLAVANVPVTVSSTFTLQKNRGQSFRLFRYEAPEGQVNHTYEIEIGNGSSLYALEQGDDGNSAVFKHYRNMSDKKRQALLDELNTLLDFGRLTVEDRAQILAWETEIRRIKYEAEQSGSKTPTPQEEGLIQNLKDKIDALKDSKRGLTSIQTDRKAEIENDLYLATEKFSLQEEAKNLIGRPIDLTFQFLRSGYLLITSSNGQKVYENKRLTGGVPQGAPPVYGDMLPRKCFIRIKSNGGKWDLTHGHPRYASKGSLWTQPFTIPFDFDMADVQWSIEADSAGEGTDISYALEKVPKVKNQYQIRVTLSSDKGVEKKDVGRYTPELYFIEMHIPAALVGEEGEVLWHSESEENLYVGGKNRIQDLRIKEDRDRARLYNLVIAEGIAGCGLPMLLGGAACDLLIVDKQTGVRREILRSGYVMSADRGSFKSVFVDETDTVNVTRSVASNTEINVVGCEGLLTGEIDTHVTLNNMYVGDALRLLARDQGVPYHIYENLPVGDEGGCPKIKKIKPGTSPDVYPSMGVHAWEYMQELVKKYAPRWILWSDSQGLRLTPKEVRRRTDLNYSTLGSYNSKFMPRRLSDEPGGLELHQDLRDYYTGVTVIGARNPLTGMRYSATETIPQATDERFKNSAFYVQVENFYTETVDETLDSEEACRAVAREILGISPLTPQGMPPWYLRWKIDYDDTVRGNEIVSVNAIQYSIESIEFSYLNSGGPEGQQVSVMGRMAEDWRMDKDAEIE